MMRPIQVVPWHHRFRRSQASIIQHASRHVLGSVQPDHARLLHHLPRHEDWYQTFRLCAGSQCTGHRLLTCLSTGKVLHSRMQFVPGQGFTLDNKRFFPNLSMLVSSLREPLELKAACGGSQYTNIFNVWQRVFCFFLAKKTKWFLLGFSIRCCSN